MADEKARYSYAVKASETVNIAFPVAANIAWDGYWRAAYEKANAVIQKQANEFVRRGNITLEEARNLVEVQRNGLVIEMRKPLSPFGRFYSETLKPSNRLPTLESLLAKKGSIQAVLVSTGKTRAVTNRIAFISRTAGSAGIVLEIVAIAVVIEQTPEKQKAQVTAEQISGAVGGLSGGTYGMWRGAVAGAAWAGTWASPTLAIPVIGEITEGSAIILGGIIGGLFFSWLGHEAGHTAAHHVWKLLPIQWTQ
ncbi:hypothetical protein [Paraherbaspirillum soli]|uniref:Uncharacterized protein n=1 Tax=Paraherbaspirillum soli TaxID=631222 RepID=A0ABW0M8Y7_9BURK